MRYVTKLTTDNLTLKSVDDHAGYRLGWHDALQLSDLKVLGSFQGRVCLVLPGRGFVLRSHISRGWVFFVTRYLGLLWIMTSWFGGTIWDIMGHQYGMIWFVYLANRKVNLKKCKRKKGIETRVLDFCAGDFVHKKSWRVLRRRGSLSRSDKYTSVRVICRFCFNIRQFFYPQAVKEVHVPISYVQSDIYFKSNNVSILGVST